MKEWSEYDPSLFHLFFKNIFPLFLSFLFSLSPLSSFLSSPFTFVSCSHFPFSYSDVQVVSVTTGSTESKCSAHCLCPSTFFLFSLLQWCFEFWPFSLYPSPLLQLRPMSLGFACRTGCAEHFCSNRLSTLLGCIVSPAWRPLDGFSNCPMFSLR